MEPAIESKIPIFIRNTFEPQLAGTRIYLPSTKVAVIHTSLRCVCVHACCRVEKHD
jgi:aspartokinase